MYAVLQIHTLYEFQNLRISPSFMYAFLVCALSMNLISFILNAQKFHNINAKEAYIVLELRILFYNRNTLKL